MQRCCVWLVAIGCETVCVMHIAAPWLHFSLAIIQVPKSTTCWGEQLIIGFLAEEGILFYMRDPGALITGAAYISYWVIAGRPPS